MSAARAPLTGTCHCGAVRFELARRPRQATSCNCSICRRYATLWSYTNERGVRFRTPRRALEFYAWGSRSIRFGRCRRCGCITHWERTRRRADGRVGINARLLAPEVLEGIRVRHLDGARTWSYLD